MPALAASRTVLWAAYPSRPQPIRVVVCAIVSIYANLNEGFLARCVTLPLRPLSPTSKGLDDRTHCSSAHVTLVFHRFLIKTETITTAIDHLHSASDIDSMINYLSDHQKS